MGNHTKWALVVFLCVGVVLGATLFAQKGKPPSYVWSVSIAEGSLNMAAPPPDAPDGTYVSNGTTVEVSGSGLCRDCPNSNFQLSIRHVDDVEDLPQVTFKGLIAATGPATSPCRYPQFDPYTDFLSIGSTVVPSAGCVIDFVNNTHPQLPYRHVLFWVALLDFDIMTMRPGDGTLKVPGRLNLQIAGPDCTDANNYSSVAFTPPMEGYPIEVARVNDDAWTVELKEHPLWVSEWVANRSVSKRGQASCTTSFLRTGVSAPFSATLTWTRKLVQ
jgi:hypothetical protein